MAYIGRGIDKISNVEALDNITFDGSSSYTLQKGGSNFTPSSANTILLSIDGIVQAGNFTVSGSTIDFGTAVAGTSTCNFILHFGTGLITTPADDTVATAKLQANSVTAAKLNDDIISGQTALATEPADTDEFLVSDAGTLKRIDYSLIKTTPGGLTKLASTEISSSTAAIIFDSSVVTAYDNYLIILNGIKAVSNTASGGIMFSTDNGSSFIGRSRFTADYKDLAAGTVGGAHTGTFSLNSVTNPTMWDNHSTKPLSGYFFFHNCNPLNDSDQNIHCQYHCIYTNQGDTEYQQDGAVMYDVTAGQQINYFKIVNATVNLDEGRASLYGFNT